MSGSDHRSGEYAPAAQTFREGAVIRELPICNKKGLHARASAKFVQTVWQPGAPQLGPQAAEDDADVAAVEADIGSPPHEAVERGRGLLALLPALLGDADTDDDLPSADGRTEPMLGSPKAKAQARALPRNLGPPSLERLAREELRKLQAALHDLGECRKLLAAALNPQV